jgi:WD40 repeat protein
MILPLAILKTDGVISDMVVQEGKIVVSTDEGKVNIFEIKSRKKIASLSLPKVNYSNGTSFIPKIYSVDYCAGMSVMVCESGGDFREVYLYKNGKMSKIIDNTQGLMIKKVRFLDVGHVLMGLSGDTIVLLDLEKLKLVYKVQAGGGVFSDMQLSPSRSLVAVGDESGEIAMFETKSGRRIKTLRGINLDAITRISYQKDTIISGGHDRRVGVYRKEGSYFIDTDFFVYAVGLSPLASKGVYTDGTENELQVFDIASKTKTVRLKGTQTPYDTLIFMDEHQLVGAGEENKIYYWRIP